MDDIKKTAEQLRDQARAIEARKSKEIDPVIIVFTASLALITSVLLYMAVTAIKQPPQQPITFDAGATQLSNI